MSRKAVFVPALLGGIVGAAVLPWAVHAGVTGVRLLQAGGWTGTATSALDMVTYAISFGTDPADAGSVRLENATGIYWEAAPAGTDESLTLNASESFVFTGPIEVDATDPGDSGAIRLDNNEAIQWEAGPAGTDCTLKANGSEALVSSCPISISESFTAIEFDGSTTQTANAPYLDLQCTGAETIISITGRSASIGTLLIVRNADTDCTIQDDDTPEANEFNLLGTGDDVGATGKMMFFIHDGNAFQQLSESANN